MTNQEVITKAIEIFEQMKWVSVKERVPKLNEYVGNVAKYYLVQDEYGDMFVARYRGDGYWEQIYQHRAYTDEIVAWMELPQPFEEREEE